MMSSHDVNSTSSPHPSLMASVSTIAAPVSHADLQTLRQRLAELQTSLMSFHVSADVGWADLLEKFNVIAAQFLSVSKALMSDMDAISVHPKTLPPDLMAQRPELLSIVPNVFLRTKLQPLVEEQHTNLLKDVPPLDPDMTPEDALAEIQSNIAEYDAICEKLENFAQEHRDQMLGTITSEAPTAATAPIVISPTVRVSNDPSPLELSLMSAAQGFGTNSILGDIRTLSSAIAGTEATFDFPPMPLGGSVPPALTRKRKLES